MKLLRSKFNSEIWLVALILFLSLLGGNAANAEIYRCKLKSGKVEIRDFPCEDSYRAPTVAPQIQKPSADKLPDPLPKRLAQPGFADYRQFEAARAICSQLGKQYDFLAPILRCDLNDTACSRRANDESDTIYRRLSAMPAWHQNQCELVLEIQASASAQNGCTQAQIMSPVPFMGTADEVIRLSDGSTWKDLSYKYLYLYAYSPVVQICAARGKMILEYGGSTHTFSLMRVN